MSIKYNINIIIGTKLFVPIYLLLVSYIFIMIHTIHRNEVGICSMHTLLLSRTVGFLGRYTY